jgi:superfamily II DNA or RNA helicase
MPGPTRGLYEQILTKALSDDLAGIADELRVQRRLSAAEASDRLALHLGRILRRCLDDLSDHERVQRGLSVAAEALRIVGQNLGRDDLKLQVPTEDVLQAIVARLPDGSAESIPEPLIPLLDTTLLTNAPGEPRVGSQILAEIASADAIDVVMAFVRRSGLAPLRTALQRHCEAGRQLRILTTTYTGSTEPGALQELLALGAEVLVSYDTTATRLHAKAWLFHRESGFSTAYIGSSNLTHSAQVAGLEWNVRVSGARNPDVIAKMAAVFDAYWNSPDFEAFDAERFAAAVVPKGPEVLLAPIALRLEPFQERLLEQIAAARAAGRHRNLLVSATGTGKTVMAAIDYLRLRERLPRARLLFVAHRQEILSQARRTFAYAVREPSFGEEWVAGRRPERFEQVFASIQSLAANGLEHLPPDHFDVVILDEFHHAAADTYRQLLEHIQPVELLGLTATPERADGQSVLGWFAGRIAAELRLWDAIDQHRLVPFSYFGVNDGTDLRQVPWRRGRGYEVHALTQVLTADRAYVRMVLSQVHAKVPDPARMRALGFCVSVTHAQFLAREFSQQGVAAVAVSAATSAEDRATALRELADGRVRVVFAVDLFNEGVDVPSVDTLLLLRPTESGTLFLQQLGRGLRTEPGKSVCTVLDFVGNHRREFRFDLRLQALLRGGRRELVQQVENGFPFLPAGCHMELDPMARDVVLRSLRSALPNRWSEKVEALRRLSQDARAAGLRVYLAETGYELDDLYAGGRCWSDLLQDAGAENLPAGPAELQLRKAIGRQLHVDDQVRLATWQAWLQRSSPPAIVDLTEAEQRLLRMLVWPMVEMAQSKAVALDAAARFLWAHPQVCRELAELYALLQDRIDHLASPVAAPFGVPLQVHSRYTRLEILAALAVGEQASVSEWREGVRYVKELRTDVFAFTLDKSDGRFSPTTRYRDYAINRELIHWESQSMTSASSATGQRYQNHVAEGSVVMLFARRNTSERAFWCLGPARYVEHRGSRPMAVTWRLEVPLPGDLFAEFAAAVA